MVFYKTTCLLALFTCLLPAVVALNNGGFTNTTSIAGTSSDTAAAAATSIVANVNAANNGNNNGGANANGGGSLTLLANLVQTGSQSNGLANAAAGQAASATDNANFINFCNGKQLTNGQQIAGGSCNGIVMGDIPSSGNMISTIITNPGPGSTIPANQAFNVDVQTANLVAGSFTNPDSTYYAAPQALQGGKVVGHTHITIQSLGNNIATTTPPDAGTFAFFKGINDAGNGNGALTAAVAGGLPAGVYRVCTMTSASNHQPVTMPLAQRGSQDDCNKFTVTNGGGNAGNGNNGNTGTGNTGTGNTGTGNTGTGNTGTGNTGTGSANANGNTSSAANSNGNGASNTSSAAGTASTATSSANTASSSSAGGNQNGSGGGGGGRNRGGGKRFVLREFVA